MNERRMDHIEKLGDLGESYSFLFRQKASYPGFKQDTVTISAAPTGLHQLRYSAMN
jgi:hypothetical protein